MENSYFEGVRYLRRDLGLSRETVGLMHEEARKYYDMYRNTVGNLKGMLNGEIMALAATPNLPPLILIENFYSNVDNRHSGQCGDLTERYVRDLFKSGIIHKIHNDSPDLTFEITSGISPNHFNGKEDIHTWFSIRDKEDNLFIFDPLNGNIGMNLPGYKEHVDTEHLLVDPNKELQEQAFLKPDAHERLPIQPENNEYPSFVVGLTSDGEYSVGISYQFVKSMDYLADPVRGYVQLTNKDKSASWIFGVNRAGELLEIARAGEPGYSPVNTRKDEISEIASLTQQVADKAIEPLKTK